MSQNLKNKQNKSRKKASFREDGDFEWTKSFGEQIGKGYINTMLSSCTHVSSYRGKASINELCTPNE